jgi:hypothetical protein
LNLVLAFSVNLLIYELCVISGFASELNGTDKRRNLPFAP